MVRCVVLFLAILFPLFGLSSPNPKSHTKAFYALDRSIQSSRWDEAGRTLRSGLISGALLPAEIKMLAKSYSETPFARAFAGAQAILRLKETTGLTLAAVLPITLFAETGLSEETLKGTFFWPSNRYGRELQYDPETSSFYIHLGTYGVKPIGVGHQKTVTRTIQYTPSHPRVMARSTSTEDLRKEISAMRELKGSPGLINAESMMKHKDPKTGKHVHTIITRIFNKGSLQGVMGNPAIHLTFQERLAIATDIVTGLASLHERNFVHRDLGARNYLVNVSGAGTSRRVKAVIADFGRTIPVSEAIAMPVQGNKGYLSPEGFFRKKMRRSDYFSTDIFAVGTVLWHLYYGQKAPWQAHRYFRKSAIPMEKRHKLMVASITKARFGPLARLRARSRQHLTEEDRFVQLIMQMTDPVPSKRGTAKELKEKFTTLKKIGLS